jgi:hypothetical protein
MLRLQNKEIFDKAPLALLERGKRVRRGGYVETCHID